MTAADPAERSDAQLLAAHALGEPDAFETLLARHRDRLWGLALRTTGDREDAADALQEALLKVHRSAGSFRGDSAVTTWLHRIVVNACLDRMRRTAVRPSSPVLDVTLELAARDQEGVRLGRSGTDPATGVADRLDVERALAELPAEQRAAIVLVDVLGHDVATAADLLGCAVGTVKSRCARGRARLRVLLAPGHRSGNHQQPDDVRTKGRTGGEQR